ncbi:MAG: hypothetical protein ABW003_22490 [Microvirga sp.]
MTAGIDVDVLDHDLLRASAPELREGLDLGGVSPQHLRCEAAVPLQMLGCARLLGPRQHVHRDRVNPDHLSRQHGLIFVLRLDPGDGGDPGVNFVRSRHGLASGSNDVTDIGCHARGELGRDCPEGSPLLSDESPCVVVWDIDGDLAPLGLRDLVGERFGPSPAVGDGFVYGLQLLRIGFALRGGRL